MQIVAIILTQIVSDQKEISSFLNYNVQSSEFSSCTLLAEHFFFTQTLKDGITGNGLINYKSYICRDERQTNICTVAMFSIKK